MILDGFSIASILLKLVLYVASLGGAGLVLFRIAMAGHARIEEVVSRRLIAIGAIVGTLVTLLRFGVQAAQLSGDLAGMVDRAMLEILWSTSAGTVVEMRLAGFALLLLASFRIRWGNWIGLLGALLVLWSFAFVGHATRVDEVGVSALLLIHLMTAAFWIGALRPLYIASSAYQPRDAAGIAHRFGVMASVAVPILAVAGGVFAWLLVGTFSNLFGTRYGQVLILKVTLVSAVLGLAALNKFRLVPAMMEGDQSSVQSLKRSIKMEAGLIGVALLITAVLTSVLSLPA